MLVLFASIVKTMEVQAETKKYKTRLRSAVGYGIIFLQKEFEKNFLQMCKDLRKNPTIKVKG